MPPLDGHSGVSPIHLESVVETEDQVTKPRAVIATSIGVSSRQSENHYRQLSIHTLKLLSNTLQMSCRPTHLPEVRTRHT